jgi:hypothetical protein
MCDTPLWLPKGSVRAIIALVTIVTYLGAVVTGVSIPESLGVLVGAISIYYFKQREE